MKNTEIRFYPPSRGGLRLVEGRNVCQHTFPLHVHASCCIGLVLNGFRLLQVDGKEMRFCAGECFVLNPFQPHSCRIHSGQPHDYIVISVPAGSLRFMAATGSKESNTPLFPCVRLADETFSSRLLQWLEEDKTEADTWQQLENLVVAMVRQHTVTGETRQTAGADSPIVEQTRRRLDTEDGHIIYLEEMAGRVHISPYYLNRLFRREVGIPPHNYLLQSRIRRSLELLAQSGSISRTASELGFADQSHFTRLFKRHVGITPGRYLELNEKHPPQD